MLSRRDVLSQAWPIIIGQALIPIVGIVDVAVIGRMGDANALGGVAIGATIINFVFWTFGFLRMGVTGITAQALGARDHTEVTATLARGLLLGIALGIGALALSPVIIRGALYAMAAPATLNQEALAFVSARFWGAPAALGFYAINGWLLGLGRTRHALAVQALMNGANIALDLLFVVHFHLGVRGVGLGTGLADWISLLAGLAAVRVALGRHWRADIEGLDRVRLLAPQALRRMIAVNIDIMVRTAALLFLFAWFARSAAGLGVVPVAANQVLMQFVGVSAFVLDGFAFTAEARVGAAVGARSRAALVRAMRLTGEFSLIVGLLFASLFMALGDSTIELLTTDPATRALAQGLMPYCALVPLVGVPAWLLDGVFIGATDGRTLRNATVIAVLLYLGTDLALTPTLGERGVWTALLASYAYRAIALGIALPSLLRRCGHAEAGPPEALT